MCSEQTAVNDQSRADLTMRLSFSLLFEMQLKLMEYLLCLVIADNEATNRRSPSDVTATRLEVVGLALAQLRRWSISGEAWRALEQLALLTEMQISVT